ncbi:uncharacterized protein LOC119005726 [Xyrichtys novacula]|uniref:Uncharacterized protein LOC119005726 n=1 Tax=Xyrichtys novacula TaxID=13765 RepID=A0AAV1FQX3_XYRNO|nr:uncharacterized protein LOC119005726 [Xyrichtys novacula]
MFALVLASLLFSVTVQNAVRGSSETEVTQCQLKDFCITLRRGEIRAETGLCVVIPCSFTVDPGFIPKSINWFKCETSGKCADSEIIYRSYSGEVHRSEFRGRVTQLEPNISERNCGIIISDLTVSDSGSYQLRVNGQFNGRPDRFHYTSRSTVSVKALTQKPTVMIPPLTEGQQTTLSCTAPGLCSGSAPQITWMWRRGENDSVIRGNFRTERLSAVAQRHSSTLTFTPSAEDHGTEITCKVSFKNNISTEKKDTLTVTYVKEPVITGNTTVKEGDDLNLSCSVDSFPPSIITWTKLNSNKSLNNDTRSADLFILNMTKEDFGKYICTATHKNQTRSTQVEVILAVSPKILKSSACKVQSGFLTCVCISEGFPLPTVKWPQLKKHTEYFVFKSVSKNRVNSSITVSVKDHNYSTVGCVSKNNFGEVKKQLKTIIENETKVVLRQEEVLTQPRVIVAFVIGVLLSAVTCCLVRKCQTGRKLKGNTSLENLEMVSPQTVSLILMLQKMDVNQALEKGQNHDHGGGDSEATAALHSAPDGEVEQREVEYSEINFSLLKSRSPSGTENIRGTPESEYAEVRREKKKEIQDEGEEDDIWAVLHQTRMFALVLASLLFSEGDFCTTLNKGEIRAEAGLCVVIPCSFTVDPGFTRQNINWFKCETAVRCPYSDIIYRSDSGEVQPEFRGRVTQLEPNISERNCSIIINDLTVSDSGSYQLRVNGTFKGANDGFQYILKSTVSVKALTQKPTVMIPPLTEGQQTTLSCTAPGLCSGSAPQITWMWRGRRNNESHIIGNTTALKTVNLTVITQRHSSTLTFTPSAEHHGTEVTCKVSFKNNISTEKKETLTVTYIRKPNITGETAIGTGNTLNLTCSVDSFPPSNVLWTKLGSNTTLQDKGSATLVITAVKPGDAGVYICTAEHLNTSQKEEVNVTVGPYSKILSGSGCRNDSKHLICICISEGVPLPTITWPLLEGRKEFTVITTTSNHTVNSTFTLALKKTSHTTVECVSSNERGEVKQNLIINQVEEEDPNMELFRLITRLEIIIAFLIGALLSAILCCLGIKCHRKKQRTYGNLAEAQNLEMVTSQVDPLMNAGQAEENGQAIYQEATEEAGDAAAGKPDVDYSNLDFSRVKRKSLSGAETAEVKETEYAEIKKENTRRDGEGKEEEEKDGENREGGTDDKEGEDVYSNVEDIMGQSEDSVAKVFQETAAL